VTGVDVAEPALRHHAALRERHRLTNLSLVPLDLREVPSLGRSFDYVVASGVLHHLDDPVDGLAALRSVLRPHGVISAMVYGRYNRAGVYTLQEVFHRVGLKQDGPSLDVVKATLAVLPPWHHARSYLGTAPDLGYDSGLVDTFLHARDRAYSVPEVLALVRDAGLAFQGWLDPAPYALPETLPPSHPLAARIRALPREEQWTVIELLAQRISCHRFLACAPERSESDYRLDFARDEALAYRPARAKGVSVDAQNVLHRLRWIAPLTEAQASWVKRADGRATIRELVPDDGDARAAALRFFADMEERGHLVFAIDGPGRS
jgi:SAM-dependent methyltransferase